MILEWMALLIWAFYTGWRVGVHHNYHDVNKIINCFLILGGVSFYLYPFFFLCFEIEHIFFQSFGFVCFVTAGLGAICYIIKLKKEDIR